MAHELDTTKGRPAIAFRGDVPWHGLGESILPQDSVEDIRIKAGLDYDVEKTPVQYVVPMDSSLGPRRGAGSGIATAPKHSVLYRSDTGDALSVVSNKYHVVQPKEIIEFYRNLVDQYGFQIEVVGALRGGRKVWALANTNEAFNLDAHDKVKGYLLLATSYDGTMATQARFTSVRVVCNNTLTMARSEGKANVTVPHSTAFKADSVQHALNIGPTWREFSDFAAATANRKISVLEAGDMLLRTYFNLTADEVRSFAEGKETRPRAEKLFTRLQDVLSSAPGARTDSAAGSLWGLLNAVTYDVDYSPGRVRNSDVQLDRAWFGEGERIKERARALAEALL